MRAPPPSTMVLGSQSCRASPPLWGATGRGLLARPRPPRIKRRPAEPFQRRSLLGARTSDRQALRETFRDLFPDGFTFSLARDAKSRQVWAVTGTARLGLHKLNCDPNGI
jgi:hypothetical protein